jgi:drug/metabolite transporter (DMT)-like permease
MRSKGYLLVISAIFLIAMSAIGSDFMIKSNTPLTAAVAWSISATIGSYILLFITKKHKVFIPVVKEHWKILLLVSFSSVVGTICWFTSISIIGPGLSAFLGRIGTLVMVVLSIIFLKERFNLFEGIGGLLTLGGVLLITFSPVEYLGWKVIYIIVGSSTYHIGQLYAKKHIHKIPPEVFSAIGGTVVLIGVTTYAFLTGELHVPVIKNWYVITLVPILAESLGNYMVLCAMLHIGAGKTYLIRSGFPFIIILYSFILYKEMLHSHQLIGGLVITSGVIFLTIFRKKDKITKKSST